MKRTRYEYLIKSDLYRLGGQLSGKAIIKELLFGESYKFIFWMRTCEYLRHSKLLKFSLYPFARLFYRHYTYKLGISIPTNTQIDSGFYIGHFSCIVISPNCQIGKNVNISQGVTLGQANRGANKGAPIIGDNVYIGPGAKIVGKVIIGDNVAIGANCVVTKDMPANSVVVGIPGKVISEDGSDAYINFTDYEDKI